MTWREILEQLKTYPDEVLDMEAYTDDAIVSMPITGIVTEDGELPVCSFNPPLMHVMTNAEWYSLTKDRTFYIVETDGDAKVIHVEGCTYVGSNGRTMVDEQYTFCYLAVGEHSKARLGCTIELVQQYTNEFSVTEAEEYYREYFDCPSTYMPLSLVDNDTPCGCYWCYWLDE